VPASYLELFRRAHLLRHETRLEDMGTDRSG
jgi:hypothetical protein